MPNTVNTKTLRRDFLAQHGVDYRGNDKQIAAHWKSTRIGTGTGSRITHEMLKQRSARAVQRMHDEINVHKLPDVAISDEIAQLEAIYNKRFLEGSLKVNEPWLQTSRLRWRALTAERTRRLISLDGDIGRREPRVPPAQEQRGEYGHDDPFNGDSM